MGEIPNTEPEPEGRTVTPPSCPPLDLPHMPPRGAIADFKRGNEVVRRTSQNRAGIIGQGVPVMKGLVIMVPMQAAMPMSRQMTPMMEGYGDAASPVACIPRGSVQRAVSNVGFVCVCGVVNEGVN